MDLCLAIVIVFVIVGLDWWIYCLPI